MRKTEWVRKLQIVINIFHILPKFLKIWPLTWNHIYRFWRWICAIDSNLFSDKNIKVSVFLVENIHSNHTYGEHEIFSCYLSALRIEITNSVTLRVYMLFFQNINPFASKQSKEYDDEKNREASTSLSFFFNGRIIPELNRRSKPICDKDKPFEVEPDKSQALHH